MKKHLPFPNARKAVRSMAARHPLQQRIQCLTDPSISLHGRSPGRKRLSMIDRTCLLMSFAHVCSPWINEGSADAILHPYDFAEYNLQLN